MESLIFSHPQIPHVGLTAWRQLSCATLLGLHLRHALTFSGLPLHALQKANVLFHDIPPCLSCLLKRGRTSERRIGVVTVADWLAAKWQETVQPLWPHQKTASLVRKATSPWKPLLGYISVLLWWKLTFKNLYWDYPQYRDRGYGLIAAILLCTTFKYAYLPCKRWERVTGVTFLQVNSGWLFPLPSAFCFLERVSVWPQ